MDRCGCGIDSPGYICWRTDAAMVVMDTVVPASWTFFDASRGVVSPCSPFSAAVSRLALTAEENSASHVDEADLRLLSLDNFASSIYMASPCSVFQIRAS